MALTKTFADGELLTATDINQNMVHQVPSAGDEYDTGWVVLTPAAGFSGAPRVRRIGVVIYLEGSVTGDFAAGATTLVLLIPAGFRPGVNLPNGAMFSVGEFNWGRIDTAGQVYARKTSTGSGTLYIGNSWVLGGA